MQRIERWAGVANCVWSEVNRSEASVSFGFFQEGFIFCKSVVPEELVVRALCTGIDHLEEGLGIAPVGGVQQDRVILQLGFSALLTLCVPKDDAPETALLGGGSNHICLSNVENFGRSGIHIQLNKQSSGKERRCARKVKGNERPNQRVGPSPRRLGVPGAPSFQRSTALWHQHFVRHWLVGSQQEVSE